MRNPFFDMAHGIVAEIAGQSAAEARHAGAQRHLEARLEFGDEIERVALRGFDDLPIAYHFRALADAAHQRRSRQADEGIAAEALSADDRFEQKGIPAGVLGMRLYQVQ